MERPTFLFVRHLGARLVLTLCLLSLAVVTPPLVATAAQSNELAAAADGWTNAARPGRNHGLESQLKTYGSVWDAYVRFDLSCLARPNVRLAATSHRERRR